MKFNFADLVTARPVREGRHLSCWCWAGGCFELQVNINHPCMFCGWWLGNVVCLSASCCWFHFPYLKGWRRPDTWKAPEKKQAVRLSVYCVVSSWTESILAWRCVCFAVLCVVVEWVYLGRMGPRKMGPCTLCKVKMHASWRSKVRADDVVVPCVFCGVAPWTSFAFVLMLPYCTRGGDPGVLLCVLRMGRQF